MSTFIPRRAPLSVALFSLGLLLHPNTYATETTSAQLEQLKARITALEHALANPLPTTATAPNTPLQQAIPQTTTTANRASVSTPPVTTPHAALGKTEFRYSGYIKLDAIASRFDSGQLNSGNVGRDFYIPARTPVGHAHASQSLDLHAKQSRLILATSTPQDNGKTIDSHIEMDFMVNLENKGNKRTTNGYEPELRQAFVKYGDWMAGQAWSNFMDVSALPDTLDFIGAAEGTVFVRQAQLRYQHGNWWFSIENPETTLSILPSDPNNALGNLVTGASRLPDITARYTHPLEQQHYWSAAVLVRELRQQVGAHNETSAAFGVSASGRYHLTQQTQVRGAMTYGDGIGRYVGLNLANDALVDPANGQLRNIAVWAGFLALQHQWQPKLRSSAGASWFEADIPHHSPLGLTDSAHSAHLNLIYQLQPKLDVGAELLYGQRKRDDGASGKLNRLQLSAKYLF
ncbi:MAG: DcaP family trimeric outer membrane transporter [Pseudomonadota bacterium]|nr:DcaP family trimeric outer membrane transporter [Pseudomonadota bacterium]